MAPDDDYIIIVRQSPYICILCTYGIIIDKWNGLGSPTKAKKNNLNLFSMVYRYSRKETYKIC